MGVVARDRDRRESGTDRDVIGRQGYRVASPVNENPAGTYPVGALGVLNWVAGTFLACLLAGCTYYSGTYHSGTTTHHFGYVNVLEVEGSTDGVTSKSIRSIGVRVGSGIGIGYFDERRVAVPLDCRLVIIVKDRSQLDEALQRLESQHGRELCVAIEP